MRRNHPRLRTNFEPRYQEPTYLVRKRPARVGSLRVKDISVGQVIDLHCHTGEVERGTVVKLVSATRRDPDPMMVVRLDDGHESERYLCDYGAAPYDHKYWHPQHYITAA